jgi:hypothetical protein
MSNKIIMTVTLLVLITLGLQTYMLFQLNKQIYRLSGQLNQASGPQIILPTFSNFTPANPGCENKLFDSRAEPLRAISGAY